MLVDYGYEDARERSLVRRLLDAAGEPPEAPWAAGGFDPESPRFDRSDADPRMRHRDRDVAPSGGSDGARRVDHPPVLAAGGDYEFPQRACEGAPDGPRSPPGGRPPHQLFLNAVTT
jgi:hypothetical protein